MHKPANKTIALIADDAGLRSSLQKSLRSLHWEPVPIAGAADIAACLEKTRPTAFVVATDDDTGFQALEYLSKTAFPLSLIAVCRKENLKSIRDRLKGKVYEFVTRPVDPDELQAVIERVAYAAALARRPGEEQRVETERFLGIRQVIDKLSSFISMVATDVQGGIKYFNELPYFVSIHSNDCQVLAANKTYTKYLGNRIYKNS
jgi:DNA-binding NtrC family response regulator